MRLVPAEDKSSDLLADVEVKKNYTIAELADSLLQMTGLARRGNYSQAQTVLDASVATAYRRYPNMEDEDIRFIIDIVEGYRRSEGFIISTHGSLTAAIADRRLVTLVAASSLIWQKLLDRLTPHNYALAAFACVFRLRV